MATKTISLELDAYEKLRLAKRGGESFSAVVRRAVFGGSDRTEEASASYGITAGSPELNNDYRSRLGAAERTERALQSFRISIERHAEKTAASEGSQGEQSERDWNRDELYEPSEAGE